MSRIGSVDNTPKFPKDHIVEYSRQFVKISPKKIRKESLPKRITVNIDSIESALIIASEDCQGRVRSQQRSNTAGGHNFKFNMEKTGHPQGDNSRGNTFESPNSSSQKTTKRMLAPDKSYALQAWKHNVKRGTNPRGFGYSQTAPFGTPGRNQESSDISTVLSIKRGHYDSVKSNNSNNRLSGFDSNKLIDIRKLTEKGSDRSVRKNTSSKIDLLDQVAYLEKYLPFSESRRDQTKGITLNSTSSKQNPISRLTTPMLEVMEPETINDNENKSNLATVKSTTSLEKLEKTRNRGLFGGTYQSELVVSNQEPNYTPKSYNSGLIVLKNMEAEGHNSGRI